MAAMRSTEFVANKNSPS